MKKIFLIPLLLLFILLETNSAQPTKRYVEFIAKNGDRAELIFKKFMLPLNKETYKKFIELNAKKTNKNLILMIGVKYKLPIIIVSEKNLLLTIQEYFTEDSSGIILNKVKNYNKILHQKGIKTSRKDYWLPLVISTTTKDGNKSDAKLDLIDKKEIKNNKILKPYYGEKIKSIKKRSNQLNAYVFYLVSGHGGPDPGAIGYFEGKELHEDEYAYDITLRLAKHLEENGAKVYMITIDTVDGIRDDKILETSNREIFYGGVPIPLNQKERLEVCASIVNNLYQKERKMKNKKHISINIHLDSRSEDEKVDVFYYYQENNEESKALAEVLQETFAEQYNKYQPGRGYNGTVETRNLFMLRNSLPTTVYIELGNIKNRSNQYRFIEKSNREAIAKWLCLGLIKFSKKKSTFKTTKSR
ncbi:MAG: N-acetylmuramoyl-L-alanine amidase family protein [Candidatus Kapaibacteriota bacterium]